MILSQAGFLCGVPRVGYTGFRGASLMTIHFKESLRSDVSLPSSAPPVDETIAPPPSIYTLFGKRVLDLLILAVVAPTALVLVAGAALLTALDGHNPFFWQKRVGRAGRVFWLVKVRTMVPDADSKLKLHLQRNPEAREEWDYKQKLDNDPRITRLGRFLRKSSLDELPQLWNVARGDMSIIGPRPMMVDQKRLYPGRAYFALRPGITGNWQVSDRNNCGFADRAAYDDAYAQSVSLSTDLNILVRTAGVVLRGTGR